MSTTSTSIPEFIDNSSCLCGLLQSKQPDPNGENTELWRCIGNASANILDGSNGKWWNTTLPSQELSGINQPKNFNANPPELSQAYVLVEVNGSPVYQKLSSSGSPSLVGDDSKCTGKNDTQLSTTYYGDGGKVNSSSASTSASASSSISSASSASSAASSASSSASSTAMSSTSKPASMTGSSTTSAPTSSSTSSSSSDANSVGLKAFILVGMLLAPLVAFTA